MEIRENESGHPVIIHFADTYEEWSYPLEGLMTVRRLKERLIRFRLSSSCIQDSEYLGETELSLNSTSLEDEN